MVQICMYMLYLQSNCDGKQEDWELKTMKIFKFILSLNTYRMISVKQKKKKAALSSYDDLRFLQHHSSKAPKQN